MPNNEAVNPASESALPELPDMQTEARRATLENSGYNNIEIENFLSDTHPEHVPFPKTHRPTPHRSRRGGRSYAESGAREDAHERTNAATAPEPADDEHAYLDDGPVIGLRGARAAGIAIAHSLARKDTDGRRESERIAIETSRQSHRSQDNRRT